MVLHVWRLKPRPLGRAGAAQQCLALCGALGRAGLEGAFFDERAAIREYDGALSRPEAEEQARRDVLDAMYRGYDGSWPRALTEIGISWPSSGRLAGRD